MTNAEHLPLYLRFYQLNKYLNERIKNFPKQYKYTLGEDIMALNWKCIDTIIEANAFTGEKRYLNILSLSIAFDCLKVRLRMAQEIEIMSRKQYVHIQSVFIKDIGEMIGGWLKWGAKNAGKNE